MNSSKSKYFLLSRIKSVFDIPDIIIGGNKFDFVESASNLCVFLCGHLMWFTHINIIVVKVYGMLRNLWAVRDSTPFAIYMQLAKSFLFGLFLPDMYLLRHVETIYHNFLTGYLKLILISY